MKFGLFYQIQVPKPWDDESTAKRIWEALDQIVYAEEMGLDMSKFDKDMKDPALEARINKEMNQMKQSGMPRMSVPKFLINGKEPQGKRDIANYSAIIDAELKKKK